MQINKEVVGIGLGPANLALAITAVEQAQDHLGWLFLEKQSKCLWHPGMLLEGSRLQISFLKDLVTLRNPQSYYTFVNYLKQNNRLDEFINLSTFNPTRIEFNDYLNWICSKLPAGLIQMNREVISLIPVKSKRGIVTDLEIHSKDTTGNSTVIVSKNVAIAVGGTPSIPFKFSSKCNDRIFHSSEYLKRISAFNDINQLSIGVVGTGQSAVEIIMHASKKFPLSNVYSIQRKSALKPADSSPFVNEVFFPRNVEFMYRLGNDSKRRQQLEEYQNTNYAAVDIEILQELYRKMYEDRISGHNQIHMISNVDIMDVAVSSNGQIHLGLKNYLSDKHVPIPPLDIVILATGYDRTTIPSFMEPIKDYLIYRGKHLSLNRSYKVDTVEGFLPSLHIQGLSELSHGISDSLLSNLSVRSGEIQDSISNQLSRQREGVLL